ncbi:Syntaxin-binding protein 5 [Araneus ventricosus]|uniref:Syntaxin-binding protein 5 n=1 Tax=Araneus ventricosus TaxID=182803 RepID=A0A4Y2ATG8_ARAVE|nr:Syntaxin-binding protein 5 [Araneus ventricosus]
MQSARHSLAGYGPSCSSRELRRQLSRSKTTKDKNPEVCHPITKVEWRTARGSDSFIAFAGGMSVEKKKQNPCVTVIHGKTTTVLEMEHSIIDFITLCETPWPGDYQDPYAIIVLLYNDLVVIDLTSPGYPCYQNPYPMDLHESPVTSCSYFADCPNDLIPALYSTGTKGKKNQCFSEKDWPVDGGSWGISTLSYPEVIITGHADGSLKFWDASSVSLQILYKLKISRIFEKPKPLSTGEHEDDPFAIERVAFCPESRILCVADASSHVIVFEFQQQETQSEITVDLSESETHNFEIMSVCEHDNLKTIKSRGMKFGMCCKVKRNVTATRRRCCDVSLRAD